MLPNYIFLLLRPEDPVVMGKVENLKKRTEKERKESGGSIMRPGPQSE